MTIKKSLSLIISLAMISMLAACSGSSSSTPPPPPPPPPVSIAIQGGVPTSLGLSTSQSITATVSNDSANAGVDWTVSCGSGDCGSFTPTHTASGTATTYTSPATIPTGGTVTITATSTTDNTKSASITISVVLTSYNQLLNGTYAFELSGSISSFNVYQLGGVLTADGNGNITGGEQVYRDGVTLAPGSILSGSYSFGPDGRGTITLTTSTSNVGVAGVETLGAVVVSSSKVLITEFDVSATARGSLDLQTAVNPLTGGYAFVMGSNFPTVFGGVINVDNNPAAGDISGAGSVADSDSFGFIRSGPVSGSVSAPDSFGEVTITIDTAFTTGITMSGFIVDDSHIKLVETDDYSVSGGEAVAQGSSTGTYVDNTALSGNFIYGLFGQCDEGNGGTALAGSLTADGAGNLSGLIDVSFGAADVVSDTVTGSYAMDGTGTGRATATTLFSDSSPGPNLIVYLTQPNLPPLMLETDDFSLAEGSASLQAAGPYSFSGAYGLNFTSLSGSELDGTAQIVADGTGTFTGTADVNTTFNNTPSPDLSLTAGFTPDPSGRFDTTVSLDGSPYSAAFYFIDSTQGFLIENDNQSVTLGDFYAQESIGSAGPNKRAVGRSVPAKNKKNKK